MWKMALVFGFVIPTQAFIFDLTKASDNRTAHGKLRWYQGGHTDTHLDAPCKYGGRWCAEEIPLDRLFGIPAYVLDADDGTVSLPDLRYWEKHRGSPSKNSALLLQSAKGLNLEAANWAKKHFVAIGTDGPSIGNEQVMRALANNDVYVMEGLTRLDDLPHKGFKLYVFPTKVKLSASVPVRVMATTRGAASQHVAPCFFVLIFTALGAYFLA